MPRPELTVSFSPGHPDGRRAPGGHPNGQGAGATTAKRNATAPALTESWRGSVTDRGRRGRGGTAGTGIGTEGTAGTGRGGGPAAQTGTTSGESAGKVAAPVGSERASVETKRGTAGRTGARGRTGSTIKIEAPRGRSPGTKRTGERLRTGGTKTTGRGTERRGRPNGRVGVEARRGSTRAGERRRAGRESAATAGRESGRETESSAHTNVAAAEREATTSGSPVTITDIVNAEGVRALSKCRLQQYYFYSRVFLPFPCQLSGLSLVLKRRNVSTSDIWSCRVMLLYVDVFLPFSTLHC